ncbi:glycosyltransferase family 2 protein [Pseudomonas sp. EGD-AK9]|uniref:glycosyltransferase family 2 protein n=1 Tax=Pseudomonas sp. EGD-AK9 TaxID=1386078 RepID=UPI0012E2D191|nr:glycosyltransferase family A protein [Pseudomonas sp. EGD-AK9]
MRDVDVSVRVRVGKKVPAKPEIAVVVMSVDSDPLAWHAVSSVLKSADLAEIAVVNTGRGSLESVLSDFLDFVILIESETKCFPGGARNLGIKNTCAPVVSFLAADCIAPEGWCEQRVLLHKTRLVSASSLLPAPRRGKVNIVSWASYLITHPERIPGMRARIALPYGLSYARSIFNEFGFFEEGVRIGEDSLFNERIRSRVGANIENGVVTMHHYPDRIVDALRDQYARGGREFLYYKMTCGRGRFFLVARNIKRFFIASVFVVRNRGEGPCGALFSALPLSVGLLVAKVVGNVFWREGLRVVEVESGRCR